MQNEGDHPTQRIDSTTGRDETVTSICLPPPDPLTGLVAHAYVVGSSSSAREPSMAYIVKLRLDDLSILWKEHVPSVGAAGGGAPGDVLGEGCAVSPDGSRVFLGGTISGSSAVDGRVIPNGGGGAAAAAAPRPVGGVSDVFVVAYDVDFGNAIWARQLGTVSEDKLARGGGVACDNGGNVIVVGSTRGGLQRPRPGEADPRLPSDVFVMSLSGHDGGHVHAPYGGGSGGGGGAPVAPSSSSGAPAASSSSSGLSAGAAAGISIAAIVACCCACALLAVGLRRRRRSPSRGGGSGDVLRSWNSGDDFTFGDRRSPPPGGGGRRGPAGVLRIVRGGGNDDDDDDDWDDGSESVSRNATWMRGGGDGGDALSVASAGSGPGRRSYKSKRQDENSDFIASLRQEASSTMKKMVRDPSDGATSDPRLDGGASIKSLLSHYREVKKETLFDDDGSEGDKSAKSQGGRGQNNASNRDGGDHANVSNRRGPPPPPPPRRKNSNQSSPSGSASSGNGLSEFTII
jgi:hypothetical protein